MGECNTRMNESDAYVNKLGGCRSIRFFVKAGRKTRMNQAERLREAAMRAAADGGRVTIIGHDTPDVDSVASSVLMHALLTHWSIPSRIVLDVYKRQGLFHAFAKMRGREKARAFF